MKAFALVAISALALVAPPPRSVTTTATVALVADLPAGGARAAIIRQAQPRVDVILLARSRASVEDLAAALAVLAAARERDGTAALQRDAVLVVKSSHLSQPLNLRHRLRLSAHLARLRATPPRLVDGVGTVPAIEVNVRARPRPR